MAEWKDSAIYECAYCGERIGSGKYCANCKTQDGRKKIFDENVKLMEERRLAGLPYRETLKNWK
jgi:primosomal protein N'